MAPLFTPQEKQISVAFVCLGNICRSPMAEAIFKHKVQQLGYADYFNRIDSYGTASYHVGESPDRRSAATCRKHGVPVNHRAQQIRPNDFRSFDYVIAMDQSVLDDLRYMKPRDSKAVVELFGHWNDETGRKIMELSDIVEDPYYGGIHGFEHNYNQICYFSDQFLNQEVGSLD
ncbi:phosphotyrosine protein phosphatase [Spathaspora passalidarum NRRL Y-27907]|uniref:Phosphotyrosine protein phosphatase n=1 Tax=Spathaspora passalidarum (strain NRRL Y-27907 / 11-Y1) TaxID=619300 RepID=G3ATG4_SPAPN|nr:phosphotyrosine protein phosphatase [Spathaspora passalidarum NRRL Y-27907]EGW30927.1 phosphotyrosine protein phosphatase [Spathaspora passalidarum NRRL Y-27907]